jgi:hypothetical protein
MSKILDRLKEMLPQLDDDGSKQLAEQYMELIEQEKEMESLAVHKGFQKILAIMKSDFKDKLKVTIKKDPELNEIRKMFVRVVGLHGSEVVVEEILNDLLEPEAPKTE